MTVDRRLAVKTETWVRFWDVAWHAISFSRLALRIFGHFLAMMGAVLLLALSNGPLPAMSWHSVMTSQAFGTVVIAWVMAECMLAGVYSWRPAQYIGTTMFVGGLILWVF